MPVRTPALLDARGRRVALPAPPGRIVSLVPSQTELLADLGLDAEVVGVTRFCVHPTDWRPEKPIIGGTKNVRLDRVAALRPDLVLANKEENVREQVEALDAVAPVFVTDVATVADALAMIRTVGRLVRREERAEALVAEIEAGFAALAERRPIRVAYLIWRSGDGGPYMSVGGDTFISDVLRRASLRNVFEGRTRYPEATAAEIAAARPEAVLLSSEPFPFGEAHIAEVEAAAGVPARLVDGELFSWYGSRMRLMPPYAARLREVLEQQAPPLETRR